MPSYRALHRGQTPDGTWHQPGDTFETDAPQGAWMELLETKQEPSPKAKGAKTPAADD